VFPETGQMATQLRFPSNAKALVILKRRQQMVTLAMDVGYLALLVISLERVHKIPYI
jgi:hypothetical protein